MSVKRARKNHNSGLAEGMLRQLSKTISVYDDSILTVAETLRSMEEDRRRLIDEEKLKRNEFFEQFGYNPNFQDERE